MEQAISKTIGLSGLFKNAITNVLIYIKPRESQALVKQGIVSEKDISTLSDYELTMIWVHLNNATMEQLSTSENIEIYNSVYDFENVGKQLWCRAYNMFSDISYSCRNGMLGNIENQLKKQCLFPDIFTGCSKFRKRKIVDAHVTILDDYFLSIEKGLQVNEFKFNNAYKNIKLCTYKLSCSVNITGGIRKRIYGKCNIGGHFDADRTFEIANDIIQSDHFMLAIPGQMGNTCVHGERLDMQVFNKEFAKQMNVETKTDTPATYFRGDLDSSDVTDCSPDALPSAPFLDLFDREDWQLLIETLRRAKTGAALEIITKKHKILHNLPESENAILGIAFEHLPITELSADSESHHLEIQPKGFPLKFSTNVENLKQNIERWSSEWSSKKDLHDLNFTEALRPENIKGIWPKNVMEKLCLLGMSQSVFQYLELDETDRSTYQVDDTETVKVFLIDIKKRLIVELDSDEYKRDKQLTTESEKINEMNINMLINLLKSYVRNKLLLKIVFQAVRSGVTALLCSLGKKWPIVLKNTFKAVLSGAMRKVCFECPKWLLTFFNSSPGLLTFIATNVSEMYSVYAICKQLCHCIRFWRKSDKTRKLKMVAGLMIKVIKLVWVIGNPYLPVGFLWRNIIGVALFILLDVLEHFLGK